MDDRRERDVWDGAFGEAYTDRSPKDMAELDPAYRERYGVTRSEINTAFLSGIDRGSRVLEVGANIGLQLQGLARLGFSNLTGVDVQWYACRQARRTAPQGGLIQASAYGLPFEDARFDLVFTSALLIHVPPADIGQVLDEIYRCTRAYIWGWEYFAEQYTNVEYRGCADVLWKTDFAGLYLDRFPDLSMVKERRLTHRDSDNVDTVFLLRKSA